MNNFIKPTIAFQSVCYEKSYRLLLQDGLLQRFLTRFPNTNFDEKTVIINNVNDKQVVKNLLNQNYPEFNCYFSDENQETILNSFGVDLQSSSFGLIYSMMHYTGIYHTTCDYLFHIAEDCNVDNLDDKFIQDCVDMLESNENYIVADPRWGEDEQHGAIEEALGSDGKFYVCSGFTDQIYIVKVKEFKKQIYNFWHPLSERYPAYGGQAFEKRIDSYLKCNNKYRIVHKDYYYLSGYYDYIIKGNYSGVEKL